MPPVRATLNCAIELLDCSSLEFKTVCINLELKKKPLDAVTSLLPSHPSTTSLRTHKPAANLSDHDEVQLVNHVRGAPAILHICTLFVFAIPFVKLGSDNRTDVLHGKKRLSSRLTRRQIWGASEDVFVHSLSIVLDNTLVREV
jgi:hypothetical protein